LPLRLINGYVERRRRRRRRHFPRLNANLLFARTDHGRPQSVDARVIAARCVGQTAAADTNSRGAQADRLVERLVMSPNVVHPVGRARGLADSHRARLWEVRRWTYQSGPLLASIRATVIHGMAVKTAIPIWAAAASTVGRPGPLRIRSGVSESAASPLQSTRTARLAAIRIGAVVVRNAPRSTTSATASCVIVSGASNHRLIARRSSDRRSVGRRGR
jgi:hypothetical protein